jgi:hypothetical protein
MVAGCSFDLLFTTSFGMARYRDWSSLRMTMQALFEVEQRPTAAPKSLHHP